ncbi:MAG: hypothetical protein IPK50_09790 [Fibrobacterota bacterium]|nr:MAG: hypothetical protein IPK50_09790 [Fibrobacterota bacterium]
MNRSRTLATLAAFLLPLSACDKLTDSTETTPASPTVSVVLSNSVIHPKDTPDYTVASVIAKAPAQGMSLSPMILDASNNVVTDKFTTEFTKVPASTDSTFSTNEWKITSKITTPVGSYTFKVIVTDKKSQTASQTASFRVTADSDSPDPTGELRISGWNGWGDVTSVDFSSPSGDLHFSSSFVELSIRIRDLSNRDVTDEFFVEYPSEVTASPFDLSRISVIGRGASPGGYVMDFLVTDADGVELKKQSSFMLLDDVDGDGEFFLEGPVTMGAQNSSAPSYLQIQGGNLVTWTSSSPNRPFALIDVVFGEDNNGYLSLMSPSQANGDGFSLSTWTTRNTTEFLDLGSTYPSSRSELSVLMSEGDYAGTTQKLEVTPGHYYGVLLANGEIVVLHVTGLSGFGSNTEIELEVLY